MAPGVGCHFLVPVAAPKKSVPRGRAGRLLGAPAWGLPQDVASVDNTADPSRRVSLTWQT